MDHDLTMMKNVCYKMKCLEEGNTTPSDNKMVTEDSATSVWTSVIAEVQLVLNSKSSNIDTNPNNGRAAVWANGGLTKLTMQARASDNLRVADDFISVNLSLQMFNAILPAAPVLVKLRVLSSGNRYGHRQNNNSLSHERSPTFPGITRRPLKVVAVSTEKIVNKLLKCAIRQDLLQSAIMANVEIGLTIQAEVSYLFTAIRDGFIVLPMKEFISPSSTLMSSSSVSTTPLPSKRVTMSFRWKLCNLTLESKSYASEERKIWRSSAFPSAESYKNLPGFYISLFPKKATKNVIIQVCEEPLLT